MKYLASIALTLGLLSASNALELAQRDDSTATDTTTLDAAKETSSIDIIAKNAVSTIADSDDSTMIPLPTLDPESVSSTSRGHRTRTYTETGDDTELTALSDSYSDSDSQETILNSDLESTSQASQTAKSVSSSNNAILQFGDQYAFNAGISLSIVGVILSLL
ncbi:uncharacterized protein ASCRUDRAFT_72833 [Ascoidea rubescens DSM 1968]|uniref:Uncharacterized protein n=1 Tax=Ascoidea rubescens DSM 1968 TaxID=1344418 RepID=A0A1D2V958_9ASCO|nr:hypothetical protein ASCRUDRAFT_72833 [Ascoidea rubescens DSM 1968]ODV58192.1 hypothetical protein ASCRUDRAFT_72833 [Ascoidea rubescens DSM 1968]